ncbi:MAG: DMT family transporter [Dehalococcoidia bacterium]
MVRERGMTGRQALILLAGVVAVSWAASFIRLASEAGAAALAIAALRLTFASPPMVAAAAWTGIDDLRRLARRDWALLLLSAVSLAFHFGLWVASLERTSVATSVVLVTTQPVFVGLGAWLALRESPSRAVVLGTVIAGLGAVLLVSDDWTDMGAMGGNVMALLGAVAVSIYVIVGRTMRQRVSLSSYTGVVYSGTAMLLLGTALLTGTALRGYSAEAYLWIAVMAVVSQLIGHNAINWSLAALPAAVVAVAILGEPVIASAIAAFVLDEVPTLLEIAGGAVVLAGVYVALRGERRARIVPPAPIEV